MRCLEKGSDSDLDVEGNDSEVKDSIADNRCSSFRMEKRLNSGKRAMGVSACI